MSRYTVEWRPDAEDELMVIWMHAADRAAVTAADAAINRLLANDPVNAGVPVAEGLRKVKVAPLQAYFSIDHARALVEVSHVVRCVP